MIEETALLEIRRVARRIRAACDRVAPLLGYEDPSLALFCPFAATAVTTALRDAGFTAHLIAGICDGTGHCWTEVADAKRRGVALVDVTATQFWPRWPQVLVLRPDDRRAVRYTPQSSGRLAMLGMLHEDADLLRLLPARWWECEARDLLDARLATMLWDEGVDTGNMDEVAASLEVTTREVWAAMGRLVGREPIYGHVKRKAALGATGRAWPPGSTTRGGGRGWGSSARATPLARAPILLPGATTTS